MLNIRGWLPAAALAACTLPACAHPVRAAGPARGQTQQKQVHGTANADPGGGDIPEPASMALIGLGVLGLIAFRRKV